MVIGHQKGRDTKERVRRNYGMPKPEGYRKALRLMKLAERFQIPLITLIDTPGAYPGVGSEERGQSEAIARNLFEMSTLAVPIVSIVIGEGGSGGALAIGVCDRLLMLQYSIYSVISPEGCASILWKSADKKELAAEAMGLTAERLSKLGLVDEVIREPLGGAHRDPTAMAELVKAALLRHLADLQSQPIAKVLEARSARLSPSECSPEREMRAGVGTELQWRQISQSRCCARRWRDCSETRGQCATAWPSVAASTRPRCCTPWRSCAGRRHRAAGHARQSSPAATGRRVGCPLSPAGRATLGAASRCSMSVSARLAASRSRQQRETPRYAADRRPPRARRAPGHGTSSEDQLETLLLQLAARRGRGRPGWHARGERPAVAAALARPLLDVEPRRAAVAYCQAAGLDWIEDPQQRRCALRPQFPASSRPSGPARALAGARRQCRAHARDITWRGAHPAR